MQWEKKWEMEFNPSKCIVLNITKKKKKISFDYRLHGQVLETVDNAKYLGVTISEDLSWNKHIDNITSNANKTLGFLRRNIQTKNKKIRETAYKTLVRPQVEYASTVWSPYTTSYINKVEKVQRRAARWVQNNFSHYDSVTCMQKDLGWQTLQYRRDITRVTMFYKIVNCFVAVPIPTYLERPVRITRHMHTKSFRQIHTNASYFKYSFFPYTVILWNSLPETIIQQPDIAAFKKSLDSFQIVSRP